STTARVRSWTVPNLARTLGSRRVRAKLGSEEMVDDRLASDSLRLGGEAHLDAMAEHRLGQGAHVFAFGREATVKHGAGLGGEDQILRGPGTGAPRDILSHELRGVLLPRSRPPGEAHRVADGI